MYVKFQRAAVFAALFLCACADQELTNSGLISNFNSLEPVETSQIEKNLAMEEFVVEDAAQRTFAHVAIAPVRYALNQEAQEELEPEDREKLAAYFDASIRKELEGFPLLDNASTAPFPCETFYVETVITDINGSEAWLNILLTATVALPFDTGGITAEVTIRNVHTQEEVAAFRAYREGTMFHVIGGATEYGHAEGGLDVYARKIKELLGKFQCEGCVAVPATAAESDTYN